MKTARSLLTLGFVSGFFFAVTGSAFAQTTDITADNVTIQQSMSLGLIYSTGPQSQAQQFPGMRILTTQSASWQTFSSTIPGYSYDQSVIVEDYDWIPEGYWVDDYETQQVGTQDFPEVLDENGNVITAAYSEPLYGPVLVGQHFESTGSHWGVVGTHQEIQTIEVPPQYEFYEDWSAEAPKVEFQASRSDTNWIWTVPANEQGQRTILTLWDGGLRLGTDTGPNVMALGQSSLQYCREWSLTNGTYHSAQGATTSDSTEHVHGFSEQIGSALKQTVIKSKLGDGVNLQHQETIAGTTTSTQTQINARSASFGGVVEVAGDMKVQGVLRVPARGGISMGIFTDGPQP